MLRIGEIVRTNYGTGPYRITEIDGPCVCPEYVGLINGDASPSEPHYHLTCAWAGPIVRGIVPKESYLSGYRPDGTNVWCDDKLSFEGAAPGVTSDLFYVA